MSALEVLRIARTAWLLVHEAASTGPARSSRKPWLKGRYMRGSDMRCSPVRHWPTPAFLEAWRPVCPTYNLTLRANQVLSRCSSQNSCKLVTECSLCLARHMRAVRQIKGGSAGIKGTRSGAGAGASDGSRPSTAGNPAPLSESKHSRCSESRSRDDLWLRIVAVLIAMAQILQRAHGVALWKVGACASILVGNAGYQSAGRDDWRRRQYAERGHKTLVPAAP